MRCSRLERALDQGILPTEIIRKSSSELVKSVAEMVAECHGLFQ